MNQNWIACCESLPKNKQKCLVSDPKGGQINCLYVDSNWFDEDTNKWLSFVPKFWKERASDGWF